MRIKHSWRNRSIFISMIGMLVCLFISRAALSLSMMLFFILTIVHGDFGEQVKRFWRSPVLLAMATLFFIPLVSVFWSQDRGEWAEIMRIKLPLFFFPLAFAGRWTLNPKEWHLIAVFFLILIFGGCCWSLFQYFQNLEQINQSYLRAQLITTPLENDHIRFSWLVAVAVLCCFLLMEREPQTKWKVALTGFIIFFAVYLHVLAARMGLLCLYVFLGIYLISRIVSRARSKWSVFLLIFLLALPLLAWITVPTFQNRIRYFIYDISNVQSHVYLPGSNDGIRVLSLRAGWHVASENPWGVGAGDLENEVHKWYAVHASGLSEQEKFLPSSEGLIYAGFGGWISLLGLGIVLSLPFFYPVKKQSLFWYSLNVLIAFSFVFDMSIEAQFGVFIYAFLALWWWKWFNQPDTHE